MKQKIKVLLCLLTTFSLVCMAGVQNTFATSGLKVHYIDVGYLSQSNRIDDETTRRELNHLLHNDFF